MSKASRNWAKALAWDARATGQVFTLILLIVHNLDISQDIQRHNVQAVCLSNAYRSLLERQVMTDEAQTKSALDKDQFLKRGNARRSQKAKILLPVFGAGLMILLGIKMRFMTPLSGGGEPQVSLPRNHDPRIDNHLHSTDNHQGKSKPTLEER